MKENLIIKQNLKNLLKEYSKKHKISINEIIKKAGINEKLYFQYLSVPNRRIPSIWIAKISKVTNIPANDFFKGI